MVRVPFRAAADRVRHRLSQLVRPASRGRTAARRRPRTAVRTGAAAPGDLTGRVRRPGLRALGMLAVVVLGAWLGLLAVGSIRTPVGPWTPI